ncbi:MAG: dolichyl-phosphate beta-glucosyltransferase [Geobacteraceae bacterium]
MMLSIVIAAFNEEQRIGSTLLRIVEFLAGKGLEYEIIVVDDGSVDGTKETLTALRPTIPNLSIIHYEVNRGKGYALRAGVLASHGDMVLVTDADLSTPIGELEKLASPILAGECEAAIGSRALALSELIRKQSCWRQGMGRVFNRIVRLMVLEGFFDTQCGFKAFTGDVARELFGESKVNRFAYDVEILALARQKGYRVIEMPIAWINSPDSRVNPIADPLQMLCDLCRIRLRLGKCGASGASQETIHSDRSVSALCDTSKFANFPSLNGRGPEGG